MYKLVNYNVTLCLNLLTTQAPLYNTYILHYQDILTVLYYQDILTVYNTCHCHPSTAQLQENDLHVLNMYIKIHINATHLKNNLNARIF